MEKATLNWQPVVHLLPTDGYQQAGMHNRFGAISFSYYGTVLVLPPKSSPTPVVSLRLSIVPPGTSPKGHPPISRPPFL